jgi:outer membrane protein assembly factor BamB
MVRQLGMSFIVVTLVLSVIYLVGCDSEKPFPSESPPQSPTLSSPSPKSEDGSVSVEQGKHEFITLEWEREIGKVDELIIYDGVIYAKGIGSEGPQLYAIDPFSGKVLNKVRVGPYLRIEGVTNDSVVLMKHAHPELSLEAYDRKNLSKLWTNEYHLQQAPSLMVTSQGIWLGNCFEPLSDRKGIMLDPLTGEILWEANGYRPLCKGQNSLYCSSPYTQISSINRLDAETGQTIWSKNDHEDSKWLNLLAETENNLLVQIRGENEHWLGALSIESGDFKWKTEELEGTNHPDLYLISITERLAVVRIPDVSGHSVFYGIDLNNGKIVWEKWFKFSRDNLVIPIADRMWQRQTWKMNREYLILYKYTTETEKSQSFSFLNCNSGEEVPIDISKELTLDIASEMDLDSPASSRCFGNYFRNFLITSDDTAIKGYKMKVE